MKVRKGYLWPGIGLLLLAAALLCGFPAQAGTMELPEGAAENIGRAAGIPVQMKETAKGYENADEDSKAAAELEEGRKLILLEETEDGWCRVMDAGRTMYVRSEYIEEADAAEALTEEMKRLEKARAEEAEQDVRARKQLFRRRAWGIVIAALIAGIFIAGIVAAVRSGEPGAAEEETGGEAEGATGEADGGSR